MDGVKFTEGKDLPRGLVITRYDHGGGRLFFERDGKRDLIMDIYDDEPGERREAIITAVLAAGILK